MGGQRAVNWITFQPKKDLVWVLISWILVVATFYLAFNIFTIKRVALNFITFGVLGVLILGIIAPTVWFTLVLKRPIAGMGIKRDKLLISVILGLGFTVVQYFLTLRNITLPGAMELIPLMTMAIAVGLYENIFYRGWMQLRMEESFGILPSVILSAGLYSLYHIGYGMRPDELIMLFIVGLVYAAVFRITGNLFILFPFLTPTGAIFSQLQEGLSLPFPATYGFAEVIIVAIIALVMINRISKRRQTEQTPVGEAAS